MKKALTLVLALAITLGVTGCTKKTGNPTQETSQTTVVSEEKIEFDVCVLLVFMCFLSLYTYEFSI